MRIFIIDPGAKEDERQPLTLINPVLLSIDDHQVLYEEGCLSFPEHYAEIERPDKLKIEYLDEELKKVLAADGLHKIIQHELDHLNDTLCRSFKPTQKRCDH